MKKVILCLAILLLPTLCFAGNSDSERLEAAKRYAETTNFPKLFQEMTDGVARTLPPEKAEAFRSFMGSMVEDGALEKSTIILMAKHFTTEELNALADFYGSEMGKKILSKFGPYMTEVNLVMKEFMIKALKDFRAKLERGDIQM